MDDLKRLRLLSVLWTLELLALSNGTGPSAEPECPIEITPDKMVVEYRGSGQTATCNATSTGARNLEGEVSWEVQGGVRTDSASWSVNTHEDWNESPVCTATFKGIGRCHKRLDFTLYKMPDSVSIRRLDNLDSVMEETQFQLQCDITNVAPVQKLAVRWYRENEAYQPRINGSVRVSGCRSDTDCPIRTPVNVLSTINVTLGRQNNGTEFRCEAHLDLGSERLQLPPSITSDPLNITVYYKPTINTTKLPKTVPVFRGYPEELVCEADGHPAPEIQWLYSSDKKTRLSGNKLTVYEAGFYNCSASNAVAATSHEVEVILKEDYLPLIAGFVAVTVVAISVVFLFIYSIYYKNTKMRRYSLKNPKLSTHNGNVAHNGLDMQFPMTKLS
ncbi:hemicentin-2-like [Symphorus nematophorus]